MKHHQPECDRRPRDSDSDSSHRDGLSLSGSVAVRDSESVCGPGLETRKASAIGLGIFQDCWSSQQVQVIAANNNLLGRVGTAAAAAAAA
jgi:hypothetical protein